jgi:hypothetical protein
MRIQYDIRFSDLLLFNAVHQFLSPPCQILYLLCSVPFYWYGLELAEGAPFHAAVIALLGYGIFWILQFSFNVIYLFSRKNHGVLTEHVIELHPDGLLEETKFNKSLFYWPGIVKAVSRPGFIGVYVTPHIAHIIPNRAFSSPSERSEFLAQVRGKIDAKRI